MNIKPYQCYVKVIIPSDYLHFEIPELGIDDSKFVDYRTETPVFLICGSGNVQRECLKVPTSNITCPIRFL